MSFDTNFDAAVDGPVERLITALRSPLSEGFEWNFRRYDNCACGLVRRLGFLPSTISHAIGDPEWADHPLASDTQEDGLVPLYGVPARDVTPTMVADALERLIAP